MVPVFLVPYIVTGTGLRICERPMSLDDLHEAVIVSTVGVVGMVLLGEMPEDTFNGFSVGVRTQLQQLVVINEFMRAHKSPSLDWLGL